jgi:hypothetical protein
MLAAIIIVATGKPPKVFYWILVDVMQQYPALVIMIEIGIE